MGPAPDSSALSPERLCCQATAGRTFIIYLLLRKWGLRRESSQTQSQKPACYGGKEWEPQLHIPGLARAGARREGFLGWTSFHAPRVTGGCGVEEFKRTQGSQLSEHRGSCPRTQMPGLMASCHPTSGPVAPFSSLCQPHEPQGKHTINHCILETGADGGSGGKGGSQVMFGKVESTVW